VHAHPDDETLATGALVATWAAAGLPVTVVTCTRGERGEVLALAGTTSEGLGRLEGDGPALAAHREGELAAALTALGGGDAAAVGHVFLDRVPPPGAVGERDARFEDSGMAWVAPGIAGPDPAATSGFARVPLDEAAARLAAVVRERRPAVVATYEPGGGYGHPDHVRAHQVVVRALELAADPAAEPAGRPLPGEPWVADLWQVVAADVEVRAARRALAADGAARALAARAGLTFADPDEALPPVARPAASLGDVVEVEVAPVLDRVLGALRAHATQVQHAQASPVPCDGGVLGWYALSNGVLAPLTARETYAVRRGVPRSVGSAR
jgi:N-acetyl-1-D-myo-inositol-2-amino-2-deoxy-alpha-D-glucopyranoside deacetylase